MAEADLRNMVMNFRVSDLQVLLGYAGKNKTGKKQELQSRALDLVKHNYPQVVTKIKELHTRRYHNQLITRPTNYDIPERTLADRPISNYESSMNNNYSVRCNPNVRPMPMNHGPPASYPGKQYMPPVVPNHPHYSAYADVKFRELPFYDIQHVLLRPFCLLSDTVDRVQENTYTFCLSPQEAHDIAVSKDATGNYECQILLRFCILENGTEQDDNFPPSVSVTVNDKSVPLPNPVPINRPGVEPKRPSRPVNITPFTKLSPTVNNVLSIKWSSTYGRSYAAVLYVARQASSFALLQRLKSRGPKSEEITKTMIIQELRGGQDCEIATTSLKASLVCPLGKVKMGYPCRATTCSHIACFDALSYLQLNEKKAKWKCPVCYRPALFKNLVIDGLFTDIISKVPPECNEVQLNDDGSWTPDLPSKAPVKEPVAEMVMEPSTNSTSKPVEVVDICDSDSEDTPSSSNQSHTNRNARSPPLVPIPPKDYSRPSFSLPPPLLPKSYHPVPSVNTPITGYGCNLDIFEEPVPASLAGNAQSQMDITEPLDILPDILPPASNSGLYSSYSNSDSAAFCANNSSTFQQPPASENNSDSYNYDFYSLLSLPESEQQKYESMSKELAEKESNPTPDIISLDD